MNTISLTKLKSKLLQLNVSVDIKPAQESVTVFILNMLTLELPGVFNAKESGMSANDSKIFMSKRLSLKQFIRFYENVVKKLSLDEIVTINTTGRRIIITWSCSNNFFRCYPRLFIVADRRTNVDIVVDIDCPTHLIYLSIIDAIRD